MAKPCAVVQASYERSTLDITANCLSTYTLFVVSQSQGCDWEVTVLIYLHFKSHRVEMEYLTIIEVTAGLK